MEIKLTNKTLILMACMLVTLLSGCKLNGVQGETRIVTVNPAFVGTDNNRPFFNQENTNFQIKGSSQTGVFSSDIEHRLWKIGSIRVENWPLKKNFCNECKTSLGRRHHPDGATVWLKLINEVDRTLYVVSSYQKQFYALGWKFQHKNTQVKITQIRSKKEMLVSPDISFSKRLNTTPECFILWANKRLLKQPGPGISTDVAQFQSQFIIQCDS